MIREPSEFRDIAENAQLTNKERDHFIEGMTTGAEDLSLDRVPYTLLQAALERDMLVSLGRDLIIKGDEPRPFAYDTPKPLTPLYTPSHPRSRVAEQMFRRLLGVSVMNDAALRESTQENRRMSSTLSLAAARGIRHGSNLFSTTLEEVQASRMAMHLERPEGSVRVAFEAAQQPATSEGRVIFGDQATAMYRDVVALHQKNIEEGRGAEYVYEAITGQALRR